MKTSSFLIYRLAAINKLYDFYNFRKKILTYLFFQYKIISIHPNLTNIISKIYLFSFRGKVNMEAKKLVTLAVLFMLLRMSVQLTRILQGNSSNWTKSEWILFLKKKFLEQQNLNFLKDIWLDFSEEHLYSQFLITVMAGVNQLERDLIRM